jgi:hypothetical protein
MISRSDRINDVAHQSRDGNFDFELKTTKKK